VNLSKPISLLLAIMAFMTAAALLGTIVIHPSSVFLSNWGIDFGDYWLSGSRVLHGQSPYAPEMLSGPFGAMGQDRFRYPPLFALLISPLALLPLDTAKFVWAVISIAGLLGGCWLAGSAGGARRGIERFVWMLASMGFFFPVFDSLLKGNVEGVEVLIIGLALMARPAITSFLLLNLGILKVAPTLIWPAAAQRFGLAFWRAAAVMAVILLVSLPLLLRGWLDFPTVLINELRGSSEYLANLAPSQALTTLLPTYPDLALAVRVLTLGASVGLVLASIWYARRPGGWPASLFAAVVASLLLPSVIWLHYLVLLLPFLFFTWSEAKRMTRLLLILEFELTMVALIFPSGGILFALPLISTLMYLLHARVQAESGQSIRKASFTAQPESGLTLE
jgi:alpha-1,2-mannosyltransferase